MKIKLEDDDAALPPSPKTCSVLLEAEKQRYPGASTWAPSEERLFEILFRRAERPLLPSHWDVDFRGIPVLDSIFHQTQTSLLPVVYSCSGDDFRATTALIHLIDLTTSVRTLVQANLAHKVPRLIKASLDKYIAWAARDGAYAEKKKLVPNVTTAVLDAASQESDITAQMEQRMRALALAQKGTGTRRRPLPVVYGLFVLRSSVFLLTVDSAKGESAYVSFHVDVHFADRRQSVWNALTVAIVVCLARDQIVERMDEFEQEAE